jgi:hypothetical protein
MSDHSPQITEIRQTCAVAPSQWDGRLTDTRPIYIRYRWGYLSVAIGEPGASVESAVDASEWFGEQIRDSLDSKISIEEVCLLTGLTLSK